MVFDNLLDHVAFEAPVLMVALCRVSARKKGDAIRSNGLVKADDAIDS